MTRKIFLLMALLLLIIPVSARAQDETELSSLSVDLWPEFDRPNMLVMYLLSLAPEASLPAEVKVRIPAEAQPNAVAVCEASGNCFNAEYTQQVENGWNVLSIQATLPGVRVEYYDPALEKDGTSRSYTYTWPGDYPVDALKVTVQQPVGAKEMQIKPGQFNPSPGQDGLNYYVMDAGSLEAGETVQIQVSYQKETDELTYNNVSVEASEPLDSTESGRSSLTAALPIVLGLIGVLLIGGGGLWYWRSGRQPHRPARERHPRRKASDGGAAAAEDQVYCHQCGARAMPDDRFCRACGEELRR